MKSGIGTYGVLPEEWLRKCGLLAGLGRAEDGHLRFSRGQVGVLDALLAATADATCDAAFARARDELRRFERIEPCDAPAEFVGQLRPYQRDGLGWLDFLGRFGFGGCLADDMGLGKTVQVLALLEARRAERERSISAAERPRPSLVVVPRSLVFNWKAEAERFAPKLRVLDHAGIDRLRGIEHFDAWDVVITTYGTLRRDIVELKDARFDYVVLDEAQRVGAGPHRHGRAQPGRRDAGAAGPRAAAVHPAPHQGVVAALLEVGGDAIIRKGLRGAAIVVHVDDSGRRVLRGSPVRRSSA